MILPEQLKLCFLFAASPTENFYSQISMFRIELDALGGIYKQSDIIITLGDDIIAPLPAKWKTFLGNNLKLYWTDPELFHQHRYIATGDTQLNFSYDEYDVIIFCDADTILIRPIGELLSRIQQSPAIMGVIAHYPFPTNTGENAYQIWNILAKEFIGKPLRFDYHYSLLPEEEATICPFYINWGFAIMTSQILNTMRNTYLSIRPKIAERIKYPEFSTQIALTLSILAHNISSYDLPMRYNFPNDSAAEILHQAELEDVRLIHYLRTDKFDRQKIFINEAEFGHFLSLKLEGSNKVFQDHIRKLTNGHYPFK